MKNRILPELNDEFAASVREGLTYDELYNEVRNAVGEDSDRRNKENRNRAIEEVLCDMVTCEIPETLVNEQAKEKFARMMADQRDAGVPDEEIQKMVTKEGFEKYKNISRKSIERVIAASIAIDDLGRKHVSHPVNLLHQYHHILLFVP